MSRAEVARISDLAFRTDSFAPGDLRVTALQGREGVGVPFVFDVELCTREPDVDVDAQLGEACSLRIAGQSGTRYVNGIIQRFEYAGHGVEQSHYRARITPAHWLLSKRFQSRIFQEYNCEDMSIPGVIRRVLLDAGITEDRFELVLHEEHRANELTVQYRESDWTFITRLMEREGLFYFFTHTETNHKLVIADAQTAFPRRAADAAVVYRAPSGLVDDEEVISAVSRSLEIESGAVRLKDFDFKRPGEDLTARVAGERFDVLEHSDWPGGHQDRDQGERYARIRLEALQARAQRVRLRGSVRDVVAGELFELRDHPSTRLNGDYLPVCILHRATQPQSAEEEAGGGNGQPRYEVEIEALPADVPYRALPETPAPLVTGSQTAIVVGPEREEIYTDEYGRVKVQFHWDLEGAHTEHASAFMRVSQGLAGGRYGALFLPRVGHEVIVDFLDGNPERPLVVGRVYNGDLLPPYPLPAEKSKSGVKTHTTPDGGGCNEIRFEDRRDEEQLLIQAQRRMDTRVKATHHHTNSSYHLLVGGQDKSGKLYGEYRQLVHEGKHTHVKGDVVTGIGGDEIHGVDGFHWLNVRGEYFVSVKDAAHHEFKGGHRHEVDGPYHCSGTSVKIEAPAGIELASGPSSIILTPAGIFMNGPMVYLNTGAGPAQPVARKFIPPEDVEIKLPGAAELTRPGQDVRYDGVVVRMPPVDPDELGERLSFVDIRVHDAEDEPVRDEPIIVRLEDGSELSGVTDARGVARFEDVRVGGAEFQLPRRQPHVWQFISIDPSA